MPHIDVLQKKIEKKYFLVKTSNNQNNNYYYNLPTIIMAASKTIMTSFMNFANDMKRETIADVIKTLDTKELLTDDIKETLESLIGAVKANKKEQFGLPLPPKPIVDHAAAARSTAGR